MPGYKGADVHSRGEKVEQEAFFFLDELEAVVRDWITRVYHRRHHRGLVIPEVPGLKLSPLDMFEHGVSRAGPLRIPVRPHLALEFLQEVRTTIQHYGVEINGLRYNGEALNDYRNRPSPYQGADAGKWPIAMDPGDIRTVYFQDPRDFSWHPLAWEHAPALNGPASREAVDYARRLAGQTHRFPDTRRALVELLERWGAGLTADRTERRMAVRLSQERLRLVGDDDLTPRQGGAPARLPAARRAADSSALPGDSSGPEQTAIASVGAGGDDDRDDECDAAVPDAAHAPDGEDDFYADAWESR